MEKPCENCGTEENVKETELGCLCDACYAVLFAEHFDIIDNDDGGGGEFEKPIENKEE